MKSGVSVSGVRISCKETAKIDRKVSKKETRRKLIYMELLTRLRRSWFRSHTPNKLTKLGHLRWV